MRGGTCRAEENTEMMADLSERHRQMQKAFTHASLRRREPVPETGEWGGGQMDDPALSLNQMGHRSVQGT
ncbi:hypothetical protein [Streptomyces sp. NPDC001537]